MVRAQILAWAVVALLYSGQGAAADQMALSPQEQQLVQGAVTLLGFTAGSPLTPAERATAYDFAARERKEVDARDPRKAASEAPQYAAMLRVASGPAGPAATRLRAALRNSFASKPECVAIIAAHDTVVWLDPAGKRVFTERTLRGLQMTYAWFAAMENLPPPGPDFIDRERAFLRENLGIIPADQQDAIALTEVYLPIAQQVIATQAPARRASFVAKMGETRATGDQLPAYAANVARAVAVGPGRRTGGGGASGAGMAATYNNVLQNMIFVQPWTGAIMRGNGHSPFSNYGSVD